MKISIEVIKGYLSKNIPNCTDVHVRREYGSVEAIYVVDGKIHTHTVSGYMKDYKDIESVKRRFKMIL